MKESITGLLVAAITIFLTNIFSYLFAIRKDIKSQSTQYRIEMLDKVYTPIYKLLLHDVVPGDGYEQIDDAIFDRIGVIAEENFNLVDPKLDKIIWRIKEEIRFEGQHKNNNDFIYLDQDRTLLSHITKYHNGLRKSLGLPYEKEWINNLNSHKDKLIRKYKIAKMKRKK